MPKTDISLDRVLIHEREGVRITIDPASIYYLDAERGDTLVRRRGAAELVDVRRLQEIEPLLRRHGFLRIHRSFIVNLRRIREISLGRDLEVRLKAPVNKAPPVSRDATRGVRRAVSRHMAYDGASVRGLEDLLPGMRFAPVNRRPVSRTKAKKARPKRCHLHNDSSSPRIVLIFDSSTRVP